MFLLEGPEVGPQAHGRRQVGRAWKGRPREGTDSNLVEMFVLCCHMRGVVRGGGGGVVVVSFVVALIVVVVLVWALAAEHPCVAAIFFVIEWPTCRRA